MEKGNMNIMKRSFACLLTAWAVVGIVGFTSQVHAATRYLPAGTQDQTALFQSLINQSVSGDTIVVQAGDHYLAGTAAVNKSGLRIVGENGNAVRKTGSVSCIDVVAGGTTIDNIYIDGGNRPEPCMRVMNCNGNQILNSTFRNSGHSGLLIHFSNLNNIQGCKAYYNYIVGISQYGSSDNTIQWCQMYENGAEGLTIDVGSHNGRVHHNWIHKNNLPHRGVGGIGIDASNGAWIYNNTIDFNGFDGIKFQNNVCCGCDGVRIYDNENISYNESAAVRIRRTYPVTNLGFWGNNCVGNPGGNGLRYQ
jgi:parallel beta-helix repeat protein